jgi:diguanylate cyclase (GGDEF)-like protein
MSEKSERAMPTRILIIDDDPLVRLLASQAAEALGFETEEAVNGREGLVALEARQPDLVFLDVDMPVLNGLATCAAIRARGYELPVLIATGLTDSETIDRAFEAGATDFINKPLDWHVLRHRIRFLLRASRAFAELRQTLLALQDSKTNLATARRLGSIANWEWSLGDNEMIWSEELYRMLELEPTAETPTMDTFLAAVHPEDRPIVDKSLHEITAEARAWSLDHRIVTATGAIRVVHHQAEFKTSVTRVAGFVSGTIQDITGRRQAEEQIHYLANFDALTSLPNRNSLRRYLERVLDRALRQSATTAVLFLDIDRFKRINETMGHVLGDDLLKAVAQRLLETVRTTDYVGRSNEIVAPVSRLGADEFVIVLSRIASVNEASQAASRILEVFRRPFHLNGQEVVMGACIGIALAPNDARDADTLLRNADTAMHQAKASGGSIYSFFSESMNERALRDLQLESGLRRAIQGDELLLHYQPLKHGLTGRITGVEALVRWQSPEFGLLSPGEFIPLAEETGLIDSLGQWVLRKACEQLRSLEDDGGTLLRLAVNISSKQFEKPGIVRAVEGALAASGLDPSRLELEITESAIIGEQPGVIQALRALKEVGVGLALDDFGTGYSSLTHLIRFPIDRIKIDRSFVSRIGQDPQSDAIVAALVAMAHRLGLSVTAEGIESEEQELFLLAEGCDTLQGFRIGRPVEAAVVAPFLLANRRSST